mmetsp:Transcript_53062/g.84602  ORF Transcript_53062/g.84602 Transcript_53062/m.84602 type:complete len:221 (-) Transcript_53062:370-1032(-)
MVFTSASISLSVNPLISSHFDCISSWQNVGASSFCPSPTTATADICLLSLTTLISIRGSSICGRLYFSTSITKSDESSSTSCSADLSPFPLTNCSDTDWLSVCCCCCCSCLSANAFFLALSILRCCLANSVLNSRWCLQILSSYFDINIVAACSSDSLYSLRMTRSLKSYLFRMNFSECFNSLRISANFSSFGAHRVAAHSSYSAHSYRFTGCLLTWCVL